MLNFISLGSGSSGNCYYIYTENDGLMIDAGLGTRIIKKYFREYGLSFQKLHNILVTHDHADHVKSVGTISREYDIPVYATEIVHYGIGKNYCVRQKIPVTQKKNIEKNVTFCIGDFMVTPFDVPHDSMDNVGYKIEHNGIVFCLMTDIGHVTKEMEQMISDTNYLVIESNYDEEMLRIGPYPQHLKERILGARGHLCNRDCAGYLAKNASSKLRHVWLCHLSEENNHPELARKTVEQVLHDNSMPNIINFKLDVLKRKLPMGIYELK